MGSHQQAITMRVVITGKVQDVGYRAWVEEQAKTLKLYGWVRNRKDGSVEAEFHGPLETIKRMIEECHTGPKSAQVLAVEPQGAEGSPAVGFKIKDTI